ncbi:DUF4142 domain-containing protein [Pedobacter steynii]|uniref:DUF4142 domain-containing protein n=1 Tax=Pedobacter steynii TaxID=430522 RepID=A0A1D7QJN0_9SPHI|nr:DUF4142 domain-containing protein [Pedobacter steynii]AOM78884.1 hypothetical protein BFS30_17925 [Pedobacter steynii]
MKNYIHSLLITVAAAVTVSASAQTTQTTGPGTNITADQFITQAALGGMKEVATGKIAKRKAQDQKIKDFGSMMTQDHSKANSELMTIAKSKNIILPKQGDIMPQTGGTTTSPSGTSERQNSDSTRTGTTTGTKQNGKTTTDTTGNNKAGTTRNGNTTSTTNGDAKGTLNENNTIANQTNSQTSNTLPSSGVIAGADSLKTITVAEVNSAIQELDALSGTQFDMAYTQMMITDHKNAITLFELGSKSSDPEIKAFATKHLPTLQSHLQQIQNISGANGNGQKTTPMPAGTGHH